MKGTGLRACPPVAQKGDHIKFILMLVYQKKTRIFARLIDMFSFFVVYIMCLDKVMVNGCLNLSCSKIDCTSHFCLNATSLMHNSWNARTFLSTTCDQGDRTFIVRGFPCLWRPPNDCEVCFWSPSEHQLTLLQVTDISWMCFWTISSYIFFYFDIFVGEMRDAGMFEMSVVINSL